MAVTSPVAAVRDLGYVTAAFGWSVVAFTVLITGATVVGSLLALVIGIPVWLALVHVLRRTDRRRCSASPSACSSWWPSV